MTRTPAIAISAAALLMIAGLFLQQVELRKLRDRQMSLRAEARAQGIEPGDGQEASRKFERQRGDPLAEARALAEDLIRRALAGETHQRDWPVQAALAERMRSLSPAQLRVVIDAILGAESVPEHQRQRLAGYFLGRLAEDFPEEVLTRLAGCLRGVQYDHPFGDCYTAAAGRFGERDPDAAWEWFQTQRADLKVQWLSRVQNTLLVGIGRSDPALALRRAEESGTKGLYFLRYGERTTDQKVATLAALRTWSRDDPARQSELREHIRAETLKVPNPDPARFDDVTAWIEQAALPLDEISFLADPAVFDLSYHIDPRDTGKWIVWLDRTFPKGRAEWRLQRIFGDHRTKAAAWAWLKGLPPDEAAAFSERLIAE